MYFLILLAVIKYVSRVERLLQLREHNLPNVKDLCNLSYFIPLNSLKTIQKIIQIGGFSSNQVRVIVT